jgi:hypothetical protein
MGDNSIPEPEIMIMAVCEMLEINDPFSGKSINKSDFGLIIVFVDVVVIIFVLGFTWTLEIGQENFVRIFDRGTIEMQDFSLRIKKMPDELIYTINETGNTGEDYKSEEGIKGNKKSKMLRDEALRALLYNHYS